MNLNKIIKKTLLSLALISSSLFAQDNEFEININDKTIELSNSIALGNPSYKFDLRYLRTEEMEKGEDLSQIFNVGFKVLEPFEPYNDLYFGLGIDALYTSYKDENFFAIPFKLLAEYKFNEKISLGANFKYAPQILSFKEAKDYKEAKATLNFNFNSSAKVFIGVRAIRSKYENDLRLAYDKTAFAGLKFVY